MYTQLTVEITGADGIAYTDRMHPEIPARICNLNIGWITLMIGDGEDDLDRIKVLDRIIGSATILRDAAQRRINVTEAELADWAPGEIVAVFGR